MTKKRSQHAPSPELSTAPDRDAAAPTRVEDVVPPSRGIPLQHAPNDNSGLDAELDQYYTQTEVAEHFYGVFRQHFDPGLFQMVEPSAGTGSFLRLLPLGSLAYDVEPKYPGILTKNFLEVRLPEGRPIAIIGNPPFGKNASMAKRFFNHAARQADVIALILPRTFRKTSMVNTLDDNFHLLHDENVPDNAFLFRSKPYNVPAVFQVWERRRVLRAPVPRETQHPDFEFVTPDRADFAIQRVGAAAGRVHHDLTRSETSHYFIRGDVEGVMAQLDFASVVGNVAGNPSLAKAELIALYREFVTRRSQATIRVLPPHGG